MRKSNIAILSAAALLSLFSCKKANVTSSEEGALNSSSKNSGEVSAIGPPAGQGYVLLFEDNFDGTSYNTGAWFPRVDSIYANGKSRNRAENVSVANGMLQIAYRQLSNSPVIHTGGGLITRDLFGYGYYEARVKAFKASKGFHQSFWSFGSGITSYTRPAFEDGLLPRHNGVIEIDGMELDSEPNSKVEFNNHSYVPTRSTQGKYDGGVPGEWVVIGYEWLPGQLKFYQDGVLIHTRTLTGAFNVYAPQNIWLTGLATPTRTSTEPDYFDFGGHEPLTVSDAKMQVSYVQYWAKRHIGVNLLANGSFEDIQIRNGASDFENPTGWIEPFDPGSPGYNRDASAIDANFPKQGSYRLKHIASVDYLTTTKQMLNAIPNGYYKLTAWVKSSSHVTPSRMRCLGFGGVDKEINIPVTNDWVQITLDNIYVANNRATIAFTSTAKANEWIYVDDVQFVAK